MRRFGRAFLTTAAILVLLVNLVVIIVYGRQFYACSGGTQSPSSLCIPEQTSAFPGSLWTLNLVLLATFVLVWLGVLVYRRRHESTS